jgi:putative hemolysin
MPLALKFPELTYSRPTDPWSTRMTIRVIEYLAGRNYFVPIYERWQRDYVGREGPVMGPMLDLVNVRLKVTRGTWPPKLEPQAPLVIIANHPYGIVDGFGALAMAEQLGRPFRVLINKDLLKVPEVRPYSLPVNFDETREAQAENIKMRNEALRLLKAGTTIVVFPAGGVATAPDVFGPAVDLPWKTFTARMIMASRAQVLPIFFEGKCRALFHFVSRFSLTLRLSLIIAELRRRVDSDLCVRIGPLLTSADLQVHKDRIGLMNMLFEKVWGLSDVPLAEVRQKMERLPTWLTGQKDKD